MALNSGWFDKSFLMSLANFCPHEKRSANCYIVYFLGRQQQSICIYTDIQFRHCFLTVDFVKVLHWCSIHNSVLLACVVDHSSPAFTCRVKRFSEGSTKLWTVMNRELLQQIWGSRKPRVINSFQDLDLGKHWALTIVDPSSGRPDYWQRADEKYLQSSECLLCCI